MNWEKSNCKAVVIGGSAGSFTIVTRILSGIPKNFSLPLILCLHRLKDKREGFKEALEIKSQIPVMEPDDKQPILPGVAYLAPANYHLLIEPSMNFALSTTDLVQYSRPSIDVMFESAADSFQNHLLAFLLSGANRDGASGMRSIQMKGGYTIVQDPKECTMVTMPEAALKIAKIDEVLSTEQMIEFLCNLPQLTI